MLKRIFPLIALFILMQSQTIFAQEPFTEILDKIKTRYGALPGLQVDYEREIVSQSMAMMNSKSKGDQASGRIYFQPPHFLKIEQSKPKPETIVSDGTTLWWYIPDKKQAFRYPATQLGKELGLLNEIFQGLKKADEHFEVKLLSPEAQKDRFQLQLKPRPPWPDIDLIRLEALPNGQIRIIEIMNYAGGLTRFILGEAAPKKSF
ncbi:MAG: outer membrane lipoprotein carrier protein LolA, partial [Desulfobacteraceae bacterium]